MAGSDAMLSAAMRLAISALSLLVIVVGPGWGEDGGVDRRPAGVSQDELNRDSAAELDAAAKELLELYQQIITKYSDDPLFLAKLKASQRAWEASRDADLAARYPHADEPNHYGTVFPMCFADYKTELTKERARELRRWLDGIAEGGVCSGSIKTR